MLKLTNRLLITNQVATNQRMQFWGWINMMFNKVDGERIKNFGYDRAAAEWLLRNGSCVKFVNAPKVLCDYNLLPPENTKFLIQEILAENAGISYIGFPHIKGCTKIDKIVLKSCGYIDDDALKLLNLRKDSLKTLEIENCKNITDEGLRSLKGLNLSSLIVKNLPYVKDIEGVTKELKESLKNCNVQIEN